MKIIKNKILQVVGVVFFIAAFGWLLKNAPAKTEAANDTPLMGYAWSENIGWVSFNSKNCDLDDDGTYEGATEAPGGVVKAAPAGCPTTGTAHKYAVIMKSDLKLDGYAWSDNIGWVYFGQTDLPANSAVIAGAPSEPKVWARVQTDGKVVGWAKALVGGTTGSGGWDGWIKFSKNTTVSPVDDAASGNYGVNYSSVTGKFSGFAWGSDVIGWLAASGTTYAINNRPDGCVNNCSGCPTCGGGGTSLDFWAIPDSVEINSASNLQWTVAGMSSCIGTSNPVDSRWNNLSIETASSNTDTSPLTVAHEYKLECVREDDSTLMSQTRNVTVRTGFDITSSGDLTLAWPSGDAGPIVSDNFSTLTINASTVFKTANPSASIALSVDRITSCDSDGLNCGGSNLLGSETHLFTGIINETEVDTDDSLSPSQYTTGKKFQVRVGRGTPAGWYSFRIRGDGGSLSATTEVRLHLTGNSGGVVDPDFYRREYD